MRQVMQSFPLLIHASFQLRCAQIYERQNGGKLVYCPFQGHLIPASLAALKMPDMTQPIHTRSETVLKLPQFSPDAAIQTQFELF